MPTGPVAVRPPPAGATGLERVVHAAVAGGRSWPAVLTDPTVASAFDAVERRVAGYGWLIRADLRRTWRIALVTAGLTAVEIVAFLVVGGVPALDTLVCLAFPAAVVLPLLVVGASTPRPGGGRTWARARARSGSATLGAVNRFEAWVVWPLIVVVGVTTALGYAWVRRAAVPAGSGPGGSGPGGLSSRAGVALLRGPADRPIIAALAWLAAHGVVEPTEHGTIVYRHPLPAGAEPLDAAVHRAVTPAGRWADVTADADVAAAVGEATRAVRAAGGWADNDDPRIRSRAVVTVAAVVAEILILLLLGGTPWLATAVCVALPVIVLLPVLLARDDLTPAGRREVRRAARSSRRLDPHDPDRLALEVARHGLIALRANFPRLVTDGRVTERP